MYLFPLVFLLHYLPSTQSACINCGGADKTSAKRLKMPNKSVFTRLAGIELMEIFEITNQINHEVCAQQCDAHAECAVFEFNLPNKLCVLASEYARLSEDLAKGAFETIVFVKVRGKFTKALPKDKETCLDKSEYEDYVKHEVDKWLKPSPKKTSIGTSAESPTTVSEPAHTSTSAPTTTTGHTSGGTTTETSSSASKGSFGETTTGIGSGAESTKTSSAASTSETPTSSTRTSPQPSPSTTSTVEPTEPAKTTTPGGTTPTTVKDRGTTAASTTASTSGAVPPTVPSSTSSSSTARSDSSTTLTTVSKQDEVKRSSEGSTTFTDEHTTTDEVATTQQQGETTMEESEEPSTGESSPEVEEPSTTTIYVEKVPTTAEPEEDDDSKSGEEIGREVKDPLANGLIGRWQIKLAVDGSNLRANEVGLWNVEMSNLEDYWTYWDIEERKKKIIFKSMHKPALYLSGRLGGSVNLVWNANAWEQWTAYDNGDHTYSFLSDHKTWLTVGEGGKVMVSKKRSDRDRFLLELKG